MRKIILLMVCAIGISTMLNAQNRRSTFRVDAPSAIAGEKIIDEISDQGTSPWGTSVDSAWEGMDVKYDPANYDGCLPFTPNFFDGKFALIERGVCEFGAKALAAQTAGAEGVIIVNNLLGVVGMGAGTDGGNVTIPVVMITKAAGDAIRTSIDASSPVTVSLTGWRFDSLANPIDIGFKNDGPIYPQGRAIPASQLVSTTNFDENYRLYTGGRFYNFSTASYDSIFMKGVFTSPTGVDSNQITYTFNAPGVTTTDSILALTIDTIGTTHVGFDLNDAPVGKYSMRTEIFANPNSVTEAGININNNVIEYDFEVTDSVYSKCEYDVAGGKPVVNSYIALTAGDYEWGPMLYFRNGPEYTAQKIQCVIMRDIIQDSVFTGQDVVMKLYEWIDFDANGAASVQELSEVGQAFYQLTANDVVPIEGLTITESITNSVSNGPVRLNQDSYYWVTVKFNGNLTNSFGIGLDYYSDYSGTLTAGTNAANANLSKTLGCPLQDVATGDMFGGGFADAGAPAVALHISENADPTSTKNVSQLAGKVTLYPNPATDNLNIDITLNQLSKNVKYEILDLSGRTIASVNKANVTTGLYSVNTSNMASGSYFLKVTTDLGTESYKFTIAK